MGREEYSVLSLETGSLEVHWLMVFLNILGQVVFLGCLGMGQEVFLDCLGMGQEVSLDCLGMGQGMLLDCLGQEVFWDFSGQEVF